MGIRSSSSRSREFSPSAKPEYVPVIPPRTPAPCQLLHRREHLKFEASPEKFLTVEERRRGEFIHRVLFFVDFVQDGFEIELQDIISRVRDETGSDYSDREMKALVIAMINNEEIERYFTAAPNRFIRKEQEYSDNFGRLFRMDRVVIDDDGVTVIDYKTGKDKKALDKYKAQLKNYMGMLSDVYTGKAVNGIIAFVDLAEVERVG